MLGEKERNREVEEQGRPDNPTEQRRLGVGCMVRVDGCLSLSIIIVYIGGLINSIIQLLYCHHQWMGRRSVLPSLEA